jgi:hypothetical protein
VDAPCHTRACHACHHFRPRDTALALHQRVFTLARFASSSSSPSHPPPLKSPRVSPQARLPTSNGPPTFAGQRHSSAPPRLLSTHVTHVARDTLLGSRDHTSPGSLFAVYRRIRPLFVRFIAPFHPNLVARGVHVYNTLAGLSQKASNQTPLVFPPFARVPAASSHSLYPSRFPSRVLTSDRED